MLALIYDVHGNLPALDAVLTDAEDAGANRYLLGGDYAVFGAWPGETLARLRELDATWIRGNVDRWGVDDSDAPDEVRPAIERCRELLGAESRGRARGAARAGGDSPAPATATPRRSRTCAASKPAADEADAELLDGVGERRVVFGHTHIQFQRGGPEGVELVNPGSVGIPLDGDHRAAYGLLDDDTLELRRVDYDWEASATAIRERLGPAGEIGARRLEAASIDI